MAKDDETAERKPTERVVLRQVAVIELPAEISDEMLDAIGAAMSNGRGKAKRALPMMAWFEEARVTAATKAAAVEAHAGKPGTADAKVGTYRAPTLTAWKDAEVYEAPPAPLVTRTVVD